jgi:hypothetical protein
MLSTSLLLLLIIVLTCPSYSLTSQLSPSTLSMPLPLSCISPFVASSHNRSPPCVRDSVASPLPHTTRPIFPHSPVVHGQHPPFPPGYRPYKGQRRYFCFLFYSLSLHRDISPGHPPVLTSRTSAHLPGMLLLFTLLPTRVTPFYLSSLSYLRASSVPVTSRFIFSSPRVSFPTHPTPDILPPPVWYLHIQRTV